MRLTGANMYQVVWDEPYLRPTSLPKRKLNLIHNDLDLFTLSQCHLIGSPIIIDCSYYALTTTTTTTTTTTSTTTTTTAITTINTTTTTTTTFLLPLLLLLLKRLYHVRGAVRWSVWTRDHASDPRLNQICETWVYVWQGYHGAELT